MKKPSRTTRSHSQAPCVMASSSHTSFSRAPSPPPPASSSLAMVHEDGRCELSIDDNSYIVDYDFQSTPVMDSGHHAPPPRFVAGHAFFNYQLYGGLRKGGSVHLLAPAYRGYALAACVSGYAYACVIYLLLRLPERVLLLDGSSGSSQLKNVLSLQWTIVLVVGVVSDAYAPWRQRRKPYMLMGWTLAAVLWLALFVLFQCTSIPPPSATVVLLVLAFLAQIVATSAMDVRVIELSQQEEQQFRGRLVGAYEATRIAAQLVAHALIAVVVSPDATNLDLHLPFRVDYVFLHLAVVCALPLYGLLCHAHEERTPVPSTAATASSSSTDHSLHHDSLPRPLPLPLPAPASQVTQLPPTSSMATTSSTKPASVPSTSLPPQRQSRVRAVLQTFWQSAQQRVVWQLVLFNCVLFFFGTFEFTDTRRALQLWTNDSAAARLVRNCLGDAAFVVTLLLWRTFGINVDWRKLTAATILLWCGVNLVLSSLIIFDVARAAWVTALSYTLKAPVRVLLLLAAFVPTIEIAPAGTEGTTYALLAGVQSVAKLLAAELGHVIVNAWPAIQFDRTALLRSAGSSAATQQFYAVLVGTLWTLGAVAGVCLLPRQKLDAQQLRAYGGYSTLPLVVLVTGFLVAFPYVCYLQLVRL